MKDNLKHKQVNIEIGLNNKRRRMKKPWWNDTLTVMWNDVCKAEKDMIKLVGGARAHFRHLFKNSRKVFDREVQRCKRKYVKDQQKEIECLVNNDQQAFWKKIGKIGIGQERVKKIPMEILLEDGSLTKDADAVMGKWQTSFCDLLNPNQFTDNTEEQILQDSVDSNIDQALNCFITDDEVLKAVKEMKVNKASGIDEIPAEIWKNKRLTKAWGILFNKCFDIGIVPESWKLGVITPVPKSSTANDKDPLSYRGITLAPVIYKIYCSILNSRLSVWEEDNAVLHDAQNGFRNGRSTVDQIMSLTSIIETRKLKKKSTFAVFVDFKKAYDAINRSKLFTELKDLGIAGKMFNALRSLYDDVKCCVKLNGFHTDWFAVRCGLKQGCSLSPMLFNLYINDLAKRISSYGIGINLENEMISILMYANDLVLLAETEYDLNLLIDILHQWCDEKKMKVNLDKTKVVHFRSASTQKTKSLFKFGSENIEIADSYTYLGILLTEHLDYHAMAAQVAKSASRALGLVISKYKSFGGMPFDTYKKLYDSVVWSTISYGAAVWGDREFSAINAVQNRAERFFMGIGRYTPNAAVNGDMGWERPSVKQWASVINNWYRVKKMDEQRLNKIIYKWAESNARSSCKNSSYRLHKQFEKSGLDYVSNLVNVRDISKRFLIQQVQDTARVIVLDKWHQDLERQTARNGTGGNKLRTYRIFKRQYKTENYLTYLIPRRQRSAFAKFRCGVAPLRLETGRCENIQVNERLCLLCSDREIESEAHVLLHCPLYNDLRQVLFQCLTAHNTNFISLNEHEKLSVILGGEDNNVLKYCAKTCCDILDRRRNFLYH